MSRARLLWLLGLPSFVVGGGVACARSGGGTTDAASARDAASTAINPRVDRTPPAAPGVVGDEAVAARADTGPPASALRVRLMAEVQNIVDRGGDAPRLGQLVAEYAGQADVLLPRKAALYVLRSFPSRPARLAAILEAGSATSVAPEDDPLWRDEIGVLSETWARENIVGGRRRMLRESRARARRLLVSSIALYAASNRGLSDLSVPARHALRAELQRLRARLPEEQQRDIDAAIPKLTLEARAVP